MNFETLKKYKAKSDGTTVYQHNLDLISILNQLNLNENQYKQMINIINYHDCGKVVDLFQDNIESRSRIIRHEIISASVDSLSTHERIAILTHHKNMEYINNQMFLLSNDDEYSEIYLSQLKEVENKLGIKMQDIRKECRSYKRDKNLFKDKDLIYLKGVLNYCDHLASAGGVQLSKGISTEDKFEFDSFTTIQEDSKNQNEDIIIVGATGCGKTEASLFWANNIDLNKDKRLFYILPFTASINAMYKRLKADGYEVGMLHSKAQYFLSKELQDNSTCSVKSEYQTFKYFTKQATVCTIHQIFKAMFNCKFNEMMLSMYKDSIFIIDEIHCFDEKELALILNILRYLKDNYNISICVMSASIPTILLDLIKVELNITSVLKLSKQENDKIKRHSLKYREMDIKDDTDRMKRCYDDGKRFIVCVNTVKKAQDMYRRLKHFAKDEDIVLLHSAFNQRDREKIEKELGSKKILIGTQAIEVSLDIDYDEMFTEISPIDSQIQRWGRINRKRVENLTERKWVNIYADNSKIYNEDLMTRTKELVMSVVSVNENHIQDYLNKVYIDEFEEYAEYKEKLVEIFDDIQASKWDNKYNELIQFTGASVLPECLIDEYENLLRDKRYLDANSLLVGISDKKYKFALYKLTVDIETDYIYYDYNSDVGLMFGESGNII